jgi:hypothetical protein
MAAAKGAIMERKIERNPAKPEVEAVKATVRASVGARDVRDDPYRHFFLDDVLPPTVAEKLARLPAPLPESVEVSGKRELNNAKRRYFDPDTMARMPVVAQVAQALQDPETTRLFATAFEAPLDGTFLRIEDARDVDGFWLEPHTDLGVKKFTCLIYLALNDDHAALGTDIYAGRDRHVGRSVFRHNAAMVFVPGADTWHGFEKRPIVGVRRSIIVNYVASDWRERGQLAFPDQPIRL